MANVDDSQVMGPHYGHVDKFETRNYMNYEIQK